MSNSLNIIGKVVSLQGQAFVKSPDGTQRLLKLGDVVYENEVIVTSEGGRVELSFDSGHVYLLRENETVTLDASVYNPDQSDPAKAALLSGNGQNIDNEILGKNSLDQLLEETASGFTAGQGGDGNSFVKLYRIAESVTPLTFTSVSNNVVSREFERTSINNYDDETPRVVSVSNPTSVEGEAQDFFIRLNKENTTSTDLSIVVSSGTATIGVDTSSILVSVNGGLTFSNLSTITTIPPGVKDVIVRVITVSDGIVEGPETYQVSARTSANNGSITGTGTITDGAIPSLSISGQTDVNEASRHGNVHSEFKCSQSSDGDGELRH